LQEEEEEDSSAAAATAAKCFSQKSVNKPRSTQNYVNKRTARNENRETNNKARRARNGERGQTPQ
jgi:hypothetical protein